MSLLFNRNAEKSMLAGFTGYDGAGDRLVIRCYATPLGDNASGMSDLIANMIAEFVVPIDPVSVDGVHGMNFRNLLSKAGDPVVGAGLNEGIADGTIQTVIVTNYISSEAEATGFANEAVWASDDVGVTGSGATFEFDNLTVVTGQPVTLTNMAIKINPDLLANLVQPINPEVVHNKDFGSVSDIDMSNNRMAVGCFGTNIVYIFKTVDGGASWQEQAQVVTQTDLGAYDDTYYGTHDLRLSGNKLAVGMGSSPEFASSGGNAKIFRTDDGGDTWVEESNIGAILAGNITAASFFGECIGFSGDLCAVSQYSYDSTQTNQGRVIVYKYNSTSSEWEFLQNIFATTAGQTVSTVNHFFGRYMDLDGDTLVIYGNNNQAKVCVFEYNDTQFVLKQDFLAYSRGVKVRGDYFGLSYGNGLYSYKRNTTTGQWELIDSNVPWETGSSIATSLAKHNIAVATDLFIAGDPNIDIQGTDRGHVLVFKYVGDSTHILDRDIAPLNLDDNDKLGTSICYDAGVLVAFAKDDDLTGFGLNYFI